ncbi:MAG: dephospho-CoA kinase [Alistipes sp.]|nr:dephospho-CoA kinase [Alistipes sp.]
MKVIGITGGVGCGKSTVLELIGKNFNAYIVKADDVGRHVLDKGTKGYGQFVTLFGEEYLDGQKNVDRDRLAQTVFHNPNKLTVLNSIVHPLVKKEIVEEMAKVRCEGKYDFFFVEAALLLEDHYDLFCDEVWYIYAGADSRRERLRNSRGYSDEKTDSIMKNQLSEETFRKRCDYVLDNSGSIEETFERLKKKLVVD